MNLEPFAGEAKRQGLKVESLVVYQKGREEARRFRAPDQTGIEARRNIRSVAKIFASIAIGMAIDEGKLRLSDRVRKFFPCEESEDPLQAARWDSLCLEHLLTMTMGHAGLSRPETVEEALSYRLSRTPGSVFSYDNTCTFLASAMLTKATGLKLRDYLLDRLFRPLGIPDPEWAESRDSYTIGATGLFLTTSEMALFGRFLLQRGNWEGKQLVSAAWIDGATRTQVATRAGSSAYNLGYGYHFWICPHGAYRAEGRGGQFIVVFPALEAAIAVSSDEENNAAILNAVWEYLLPELEINNP